MRYSEDIVGRVFGNLKVIKRHGSVKVDKSKKVAWECQCLLCGGTCTVVTSKLKSGHTKSCGCLVNKHGFSNCNNRLYSIWIGMHSRCGNPNNKDFIIYGGRGITVCSEWSEFLPFYEWSISHGYEDDLTIDRIDNYKGYSPSNCRWVTRADNNRNKRKTLKVIKSATSKRRLPRYE